MFVSSTHTHTHSDTLSDPATVGPYNVLLLWVVCLPECSVKAEVTFISVCIKDASLGVGFYFFPGMLYFNDFHLIEFETFDL